MIEKFDNKQIVFMYEFMKEYLITLSEEKKQAQKRKEFGSAMINFSEEGEEAKSSFIEAMNEISDIGFSLIKQREQFIIPIMQIFEPAYDMIVEAQPEILEEILLVISGEESKKRFDEALNKIK